MPGGATAGATVVVSADYPVPPAVLWRSVVSYDELGEAVASGFIRYEGLPQGEASVGDDFAVLTRLGPLRLATWRIRVVERDDARMRLRSEERGGIISRWDHTLTLEAVPQGTRYRDSVDVAAGPFTGLAVRHAQRTYRRRHDARRLMIARGALGA